ncbi:triose-phosphate isomerase [Bowmanella yangjiangensis]|uniref:Triosephosphate isomerase n=1 Tax=Bowmanella yangjiangensis TaxID=2811230 RepID=A0ABS3CS98_9ALTE|nr:triose-phosphate isomerase [Bowmanella yangjiangensis]MBN7819997.1 triose-phosphate isomerase [Bowmanella yangjiangensis]
MAAKIRRPIVAGNWKMNGNLSLVKQMQEALGQSQLENMDSVVCPPFTLLSGFDAELIKLGAQNLSVYPNGAHTGEISAAMLQDLGCQYVILGHSERRAEQFESNELVADKVQVALAAGLTPIVCVGEPLEVRQSGKVFDYVASQLDAVTQVISQQDLLNVVIAYEPIWAIGTGNTATPEQAQEVHAFIRVHLGKFCQDAAAKIRILYGGSVNAANAAQIFAQPDVDGGLIGGASLKVEDFLAICQAAN